jgi:hypothetical protein
MQKNILFLNCHAGLLLFSIMFSICLSFPVLGQNSDSTISTELQKKVDEAKARKEIAEARKAELEATFTIPDADSLRTSTEFKEIKGEFIETRIQGYKAMSKIASELACRSRSYLGSDATLIIYRSEEAAMIQKYVSALDKRKQMQQYYEELIKKAEQLEKIIKKEDLNINSSLGLLAAANILGEFVTLFQRNETYSPTLFDIADKELVAVFFDRFKNAECSNPKLTGGTPQLFYPGAMPILLASLQPGTSDLFNKVLELESRQRDAASKIAYLKSLNSSKFKDKVADLEFQLNTLNEIYKGFLKELGIPLKEDKKEDKPSTGNPNTTTQTTTVTVNVYNKEEEKKKSGDGGGDFYSYLEAEKLYKLMTDPSHKGYWVQMSVSKAGGNVRVVSIPIVDIFTGNRIRFSGGAIVTYNIFDIHGKSMMSGVISDYEEYTSSKKIKK